MVVKAETLRREFSSKPERLPDNSVSAFYALHRAKAVAEKAEAETTRKPARKAAVAKASRNGKEKKAA